jgi:hypothetical protein
MVTINRKRLGDATFIGRFKDKEITVHAVTFAQAKQRTLEHFGPKKKERDLIEVTPKQE